MSKIDLAVVVVLLVSMLFGVFRGLIREAVSVLTWLAAVWVATVFSSALAKEVMSHYIQVPSLQTAASMGVLFLSTMVVGGLAGYMLSKLIGRVGLSVPDRILGGVFGLVRGVVLIAGMVLLGGVLQLSDQDWWQQSASLGYFESAAKVLRDFLPSDLAQQVRFTSD